CQAKGDQPRNDVAHRRVERLWIGGFEEGGEIEFQREAEGLGAARIDDMSTEGIVVAGPGRRVDTSDGLGGDGWTAPDRSHCIRYLKRDAGCSRIILKLDIFAITAVKKAAHAIVGRIGEILSRRKSLIKVVAPAVENIAGD